MTGRRVNKDIRGLYVFVDQVSLVYLAECACQTDGETQKPLHFHWTLDQAIERFTTRVLENKHFLVVVLGQRKGPNCPCWVEFVPERIFVL
jgi:hypothetical protein